MKQQLEKQLVEAENNGGLINIILDFKSIDDRQKFGKILSKLHNEGQINLLSVSNQRVIEHLKHNEFWKIFNFLIDTISDIKSDFMVVQEFIEFLVQKAGNNLAANEPYMAFIKWCSSNPKEANKIVEGAKKHNETCLRSVVFALQGIGNFQIVIDFLKNNSPELCKIGFKALGRLKNITEQDNQEAIDLCVNAIQSNVSGDIKLTVIEAAFFLWDKEESTTKFRQDELIDLLLEQITDEELVLLCSMLFYHIKASSSQTIRKILQKSQGLTSSFKAATRWIDSALRSKDQRWSFYDIVLFFEKLIPQLEEPAKYDQLSNFCDWGWEKHDNRSHLFVRWLNQGNFALCSFLTEIVKEEGGKSEVLVLNKQDTPTDACDQIFIARKCIGFLWNREVLAASILLGLIEHGHEDALTEIEQLFWNPLFLNYSSKLKPYLKSQKNNNSVLIKDTVITLLDKHATYVAELEKAQEINELEPSNQARRTAALKDQERNDEIYKQAEEMSILAHLTQKTTLLYGKKSFNIISDGQGNKHSSITSLFENTYSMEFPRLLVVDPVGFNYLLKVFRNEQRIKK